MERFDYTTTSEKSVEDVTSAVQSALAARNFRVLAVHDVQATLAEKGFDRGPLNIIETCNARYAHAVLEADVAIALMLPCPIVAYERDGTTHVSTLRPTVIGTFYPEADIDVAAAEVESILRAAVDEAVA